MKISIYSILYFKKYTMWFSESYYDKYDSVNETKEKQPKTSEKLKKIWRATVAWLMIAMSQPAHAGFINIHFERWYRTSYYDKYNSDTPSINKLDSISSRSNFFIDDWRLSADGIYYTLGNVQDIQLSKKALKEYDLKTVVIEVNDQDYKAKPSFKKLYFTASWKKWWFWYTAGKEIILVYVSYDDKIQVIWSISQGQFIEENEYKEYNIWVEKEDKRQILYKIFSMLGYNNIKNCDVKSDRDGNNYFYENWKLIGVMKNFWSEKIIIKKQWNDRQHIATIKKYGNKILMTDREWNIIYSSNGSKKIKIDLKALDYRIGLKVSN